MVANVGLIHSSTLLPLIHGFAADKVNTLLRIRMYTAFSSVHVRAAGRRGGSLILMKNNYVLMLKVR